MVSGISVISRASILIEKISKSFDVVYNFHYSVDRYQFWQHIYLAGGHMTQVSIDTSEQNVLVANAAGSSSVVLVCEHASHNIPQSFNGLGLSQDARISHAAWDPGAMAVAKGLSENLDAVLVACKVSRLVYDCNRPPTASDAMPTRSEIIDVPGNMNLSQSERDARVVAFYQPFQQALHSLVQQATHPVLVTIHSFTPVYHGQMRSVEIGILHDTDTRFADAMLQTADQHMTANVQRNEPYGPTDGVTHTLIEHAIKEGHLNVMIEIRNDLIETAEQQDEMAMALKEWIVAAFAQLSLPGVVQCQP
jgi:predicted N-formylglutamate amidohydrolase